MFHDPQTRSGKLPRAFRICVVFVVLALSTAAPSFAQQADRSITVRPVGKAVDSPARPLSRRNQNFARAWQFRGISRRVLQQFQEALADFNRAIQLEPKVADHYFQRGLTLEAMKLASQANRDFAKATELNAQRFPARQVQVSTAQSPKRDSQTPQIPQLAGTWKFRGHIDGELTEIAVAFTAEGRSVSIWREFDNSNRYTDYSDSGSYAVRNGKIHFETEEGVVRRQFRFEGRWLWVHIAEHNVEVAFNRVQA